MDEVLIIFPGWGGDESYYKEVITKAPSGWKILVISYKDLTPNGEFNDFNKKVLDFLDQNNLQKVNLLGQSMGGALTISFANQYPERVKRLFLINSEGVKSNESLVQLCINACLSGKTYFSTHPLQLLKLIIDIIIHPRWYKQQADFGRSIDVTKEASNLRVPTLILWGEKDKLIPLWQGEKLQQLIPGSKLISFKDGSHDWLQNNPELFWENV